MPFPNFGLSSSVRLPTLYFVLLALAGCGPRVVTVRFVDRHENSDVWICPARASDAGPRCRGQRDGDISDYGYEPDMDVLAPPDECDFGVATMVIVVERRHVARVRYECATPESPTGLPPAEPTPAPSDGGTP